MGPFISEELESIRGQTLTTPYKISLNQASAEASRPVARDLPLPDVVDGARSCASGSRPNRPNPLIHRGFPWPRLSQGFPVLTALSGVDAMHFAIAFTRLASLLVLLLAKQAGCLAIPVSVPGTPLPKPC